jgi:hypothetical protein
VALPTDEISDVADLSGRAGPIPLAMLARSVSAGFPSPADDFIEGEIEPDADTD